MTDTAPEPVVRPDVVLAAGAVLWRRDAQGRVEVALVHRPKYDDWSLPKGKLEPGESSLVAAVREVAEETGHRIRLGRSLPTLHYTVRGRPKEVRYWAGEAGDGAFTASQEVDELLWLPPEEAVERLTWQRDAAVVEALSDAPVETTSLVLLRHASAVSRDDWDGGEDDRPLDDLGTRQSAALVAPLSAFGATRIVSSDTARTLDTVRPFTSEQRAVLETEPLFTDTGFADSPDAALACARRLLRSEVPTVVCTHRPVLPWLVTSLLEGSRVDVPTDMLVPAGFWVLHLADGEVVDVERHEV